MSETTTERIAAIRTVLRHGLTINRDDTLFLLDLVDRASEDAKRLDWFIANCATITSVEVNDLNTKRVWIETEVGWLDDNESDRTYQSDAPDPREVIDAAMRLAASTPETAP